MKNTKFLLSTALFVYFALCAISIQAAPLSHTGLETSLDAYMVEHMARLKIPGAAVGIVQGDQVVLVKGYGTSDAERTKPVTPQTPFYLASVSKSFTALGIMQLVEAGEFELDTPIREILPWFQVNGEGADTMTVRHLLFQTSGFSERDGSIRNLEPHGPDALETSIRGLADDTLNRVPGSGFEYSNTNFDVAGLIIETVSGIPYGEYIQEDIFTPLEMTNAFYSLDEARAHGMATGFYPFFGFPIPYDRWMPYTAAVRPAAGLIASAEDLTHYMIAHLNEGQYQEAQVLSPAGIETLHTPGVSITDDVGYAMGWLTWPFKEAVGEGETPPRVSSHVGTHAGFVSNVVLIPEKQTGVVVLINTGDETRNSEYFRLGWDIALLALNAPLLDFSPNEDFLYLYGRWIAGAIILILCLGNYLLMRRKPRKFVFLAFYVFELALSAYGYFVLIPDNNTSLPLLYAFAPDIAILYTILFFLLLGVGSVRTVWLLIKKRERPVQ